MTAASALMASTLFFDRNERWVVLGSDKTLRLYKEKGDKKAKEEISLVDAKLSRHFVVLDAVLEQEFTLFLHTPAKVHVLHCSSLTVACDWWHRLTNVGGVALSTLNQPGQDASPMSALQATHANTAVVNKFYGAFVARDWKTMQSCYADDALFCDPVFDVLDAARVRAMWQMLLGASADLRVEFSGVAANERYAVAHWDAWYTFTATGKKVVNRIDATFELSSNGARLWRHNDEFSFMNWSKQALGGAGKAAFALGLGSKVNKKVSSGAQERLAKFMAGDASAVSAAATAPSASGATVLAERAASTVYDAPASAVAGASHSCVYVERFRGRSAAQVWAFVGSWLQLAWTRVIRSCEGDAASQLAPPAVGGVRTVAFNSTPDGWKFSDKLLAYDAGARTMSFTSVSAPLPFKNHLAVMTVREEEDGTGVFEWVTTFDLADEAAEGMEKYVPFAVRRMMLRVGDGLARALDDK